MQVTDVEVRVTSARTWRTDIATLRNSSREEDDTHTHTQTVVKEHSQEDYRNLASIPIWLYGRTGRKLDCNIDSLSGFQKSS